MVLVSLILTAILIILLIYICYFRINMKHITRQLNEIMDTTNTNQIVTLACHQGDFVRLVKSINIELESVRDTRIQLDRVNNTFRQEITNISHDLRTPLTTANGYTQMLIDDVKKGHIQENEVLEYLEVIDERQTSVQTLLTELFDYVRLESGEIKYETESVDIRKILLDNLAMYYDDFSVLGEEPVIEVPEECCMVFGNEKAYTRVFMNLINNSLKHGKGGYKFRIIENENTYEFTISNNSDYMDPREVNALFDRFYTVDKSRNKKGTGLGLAISKNIVEQFDGSICASYKDYRLSINWVFNK